MSQPQCRKRVRHDDEPAYDDSPSQATKRPWSLVDQDSLDQLGSQSRKRSRFSEFAEGISCGLQLIARPLEHAPQDGAQLQRVTASIKNAVTALEHSPLVQPAVQAAVRLLAGDVESPTLVQRIPYQFQKESGLPPPPLDIAAPSSECRTAPAGDITPESWEKCAISPTDRDEALRVQGQGLGKAIATMYICLFLAIASAVIVWFFPSQWVPVVTLFWVAIYCVAAGFGLWALLILVLVAAVVIDNPFNGAEMFHHTQLV